MANGQTQGQTLMNGLRGEQSIWSGLLVMAVSGREFPWKLPADREGRCVVPEVDPAVPLLQLYSDKLTRPTVFARSWQYSHPK